MMSSDTAVLDFSSVYSLVQDTAATIAFTTLVSDAAGAPVLHVDGSKTNQLVISITNQTSGQITVSPLSGTPTASNANIIFTFPNNKLYFYTTPTLDVAGSIPGTWTVAMNSNGGWVDTIYLANTGTCTLGLNGSQNDTLTLIINYGGAVPDDPKAVNVLAQVEYQNIKTASGAVLQGLTPPQSMALMADAGRPSPLVGSFVGPATILNDGTTKQNLTLRLVNTSQDPLPFIVPVQGEPTQSYIEVVLPVSDQASDAIWALCNTAAWNLINPSLSGSAATGWSVLKSTTTIGVLELRPDFTQAKNIPPSGTLDLVLSNVTSALEPGIVQVQVFLERFALLGTQAFGVALEKSPLVYNSGLGTGMTLSAGSLGSNTALNVTGDSSNALVALTQEGPGDSLAVSGNVSVTGKTTNALMAVKQGGSGASLAASGNVGVNTDTPTVALDVHGETNITTPSGTLPLMVRSDNCGGPAAEITIANYGGGPGAESTLSFRTYNAPGAPSSAIVAHDDGKDSNHLYFQTKDPGSTGNGLKARMTVTSAGYVGINTTTPSQTLDVSGNANVSGSFSANTATLGTTTITGLTASAGLVSMMNLEQIQILQAPSKSGEVAYFTASTDGYLIGFAFWPQGQSGNPVVITVIYDLPSRIPISPVSGGVVPPSSGPLPPSYGEMAAQATISPGSPNSLTLPVPANTTFTVYWSCGSLGNGSVRLGWIPLGQGSMNGSPCSVSSVTPSTATTEKLERAVAFHQNQADVAAKAKQTTQTAAQQDFISTLERILGKPLGDTDKQDLVSSIQGMLNS